MSARLQVIEDTGDLTSKDFTLTDKAPSKFGGNLTMVPMLASSLVVGKGEEGSDGSLEGSKIRTADTGVKGTMRLVPFCGLQVALCFSEVKLPHTLCTSGRALIPG